MTTTDAAFDSQERRWAHYYAYGGSASVYAALASGNRHPGLTVKPKTANTYVSLCRANPVATFDYFIVQATTAVLNAVEPTLAEWDTYARQLVTRDDAVSNSWEAVETSSGVWVVRNKDDITFPASGGSSAGGTYTHAIMFIPNAAGTAALSGVLSCELDTPIVIPSGGTAAVTLAAQTISFDFR